MLSIQPRRHPFASPFMGPMFRPDPDVLSIFALLDDEKPTRRSSAPTTVIPTHRIHSADTSTTVVVDLPGVDKHHVDIHVKDRTMSISAKRFHADLDLGADAPNGSSDQKAGGESGREQSAQTNSVPQNGPANTGTKNKQAQQQDKNDTKSPTPARLYRLDVNLSSNADHDNISCRSYKDGVLTLHIPHRQKQDARRLTIS